MKYAVSVHEGTKAMSIADKMQNLVGRGNRQRTMKTVEFFYFKNSILVYIDIVWSALVLRFVVTITLNPCDYKKPSLLILCKALDLLHLKSGQLKENISLQTVHLNGTSCVLTLCSIFVICIFFPKDPNNIGAFHTNPCE